MPEAAILLSVLVILSATIVWATALTVLFSIQNELAPEDARVNIGLAFYSWLFRRPAWIEDGSRAKRVLVSFRLGVGVFALGLVACAALTSVST